MLQRLYNLALLEKEGLGTAYEYYVKTMLIKRLLKGFRPRSVLIYGLPERYGCSLDFFYMFRNAKIHVLETRLVRLKKCLEANKKAGLSRPEIVKKVEGKYDLIVSSEAFHRLGAREVNTVINHAGTVLIFVPNKGNTSHTAVSGLKGLSLKTLQNRFQAKGGYIDMPPFPPGIKAKGKPKWYHFAILWVWAHIEWMLPLKRRFAHICYVIKPVSSH
jgi:hypothetical protein